MKSLQCLIAVLLATGCYSQTGLPSACVASSRPEAINTTTGWITSPNYPSNYDDNLECQWLITSAQANEIVTLRFTDFETEAGYDRVTIYDGDTTSAPFIAQISGTPSMTFNYTTTQTRMLLRFVTDNGYTYRGFNATYWSAPVATPPPPPNITLPMACDASYRPEVINGSTGWIASPNYPMNYYNDLDCRWLIAAASFNEIVVLRFLNFDVENPYDSLIIYDGNSDSAPVIVSLNGIPDINVSYRTTQPYMFLKFLTDGIVTRPGFNATWTTQWADGWYSTGSTDLQDISATTAGPTSDVTSDYYDIPLACRASYRPEVIYNSTGYILSPNFPGYYYNYLDCQWWIASAMFYEVVSLRFIYFYLSWGSEYVYIYDGSSESSRLIASLTGSPSDIQDTVYTTTQPNMLLKFTSYYRDPYYSFLASFWTTQGGTTNEAHFTTSDHQSSTAYPVDVPLACQASYRPEVINNSTGWFTSPNYPWSYYNNLDCQWLIASMFYEVVNIYFTDFATEDCCDYVNIHNGDNVFAPVIVTLRGFPPLYNVYSTTQPNMLVRFITDSSVFYSGFYAVFYTAGSQTTAASDSSTTTTWYTTAALTTSQPSAPVIDPRPYVAVKLNGTMTATGSITQSCSDAFSADFRNSFQEVVGRANNLVATGQLCSDGGGPLRIVAGQIQSLFIGTAGQTVFSILVGPNPPDWVTLQTDESCSWQVSDFVRNGNNWRQPIISNIFGCPTITVDTNSFTWQQSFWDVF